MSARDCGLGRFVAVARDEEGHVVSREKSMDFESVHTYGIRFVEILTNTIGCIRHVRREIPRQHQPCECARSDGSHLILDLKLINNYFLEGLFF